MIVTGDAILGLPVTLFFLKWQRGVMPRKPERPHMHPRLTERITRKVEISGYPSSYLSWLARARVHRRNKTQRPLV